MIYSLRYYDAPTKKAKETGYYIRDAVVEILAQAIGEPEPGSNAIWLQTKDGWIHSGYVQPVQNHLNPVVTKIPEGGMLAQVTTPYVQAYLIKNGEMKRIYRCYYASAYWVHQVYKTETNIWYQIWDERTKDYYLVQADNLRPITAAEIAPISPGVQGKRIEINLPQQRLVAYEGVRPVLTARIATGYFEGSTPQGEFRIERKQPTRHMASNSEGNAFDLPGVPWVCYISWTGVSLHGTYWHNNYGKPQSHGCINLTPEDALWIYRWSDPVVELAEDYVESDVGTRVIVS